MLNKKICLIFGAAGQDLYDKLFIKKKYIVYALYQTKNLNLKDLNNKN